MGIARDRALTHLSGSRVNYHIRVEMGIDRDRALTHTFKASCAAKSRRNGDSPRQGFDIRREVLLWLLQKKLMVTALLLLLCSEKSSVSCALQPE